MTAILNPLSALGHAIWDRITNEPVLTLAVIQAALLMFVAFGLNWTSDQVALVGAFAAAVLGWLARRQVTPA